MSRTFCVPALIALLTGVGLVMALTGDGWRNLLSWTALSAPLGAIVWAMRCRRS